MHSVTYILHKVIHVVRLAYYQKYYAAPLNTVGEIEQKLLDHQIWASIPITTLRPCTDAASEILGKERRRKKPWVTKDVLDLCDERRDLKKKRYEAEGAKEYRKQTGGFRRQ